MAKVRARKRQRASTSKDVLQPNKTVNTELLEDDALKDNEELQLESMLFGKAIPKRRRPSLSEDIVHDDDELENTGMEHLPDTDLFFVDQGEPSTSKVTLDASESDQESNEGAEEDEAASDGEDEDWGGITQTLEETEPELQSPTLDVTTPSSHPPNPLTTKSRKKAAWHDPADDALTVSLTSKTKLRKLRDSKDEDEVDGRVYQRKLRQQFEKINPTPEWATKARKRKRRRDDEDEDDEATEDLLDPVLNASGGLVNHRKVKESLASGSLSVERLRDANQAAKTQGEIKALGFHPNPNISVLFTAGGDRRLRLFNVDGHTNPHLQTIHVPDLPLANAAFHPSGSSILLTGSRPYYYNYDIQSGVTTRSLASPTSHLSTSEANSDHNLSTNLFSPRGDLLAVAGRRGYVHLLDWARGGGQTVGSLKANSPVKSLYWSKDGSQLWSLGEDSEVFVWDVGSRRCVKKWKEDGGYGARLITGDVGDRYVGIGSNTGFVSIYEPEAVLASTGSNPKPLKTIGNLTTRISSLTFDRSAQVMAMASNMKKDQLRMLHVQSLTVFANWPTSSTPLGTVSALGFSPSSQYVAVGNTRGNALLYHLRHFSSS
ncbi:WD40 repeat-like protein [Sistotremastrum suecicum HHB10207 ss-3]|uniref:WD40 repeat-like protein n=1 Tax=Sistotremastrum suecicum HHB10207 ss-3 TaxID=1314776 RepID=A0A166AL63_9AGAM|nr:WD40 repeat-like protein [Sistotremastrum suecicum HHB10207 ss-3]